MFDNFHSLEGTIAGFDDDEDWEEAGYLPIAMCGHGGAILLGTQGGESDCILLQNMAENICKIADNIFDFVRDLVMLRREEKNLYRGYRFSQLYQNWGGDLWRVREEESDEIS